MKLYATIENEKGKRQGIGGNEYLDIDIRVGSSPLCSLTLRWGENDKGQEGWTLYDNDDQPIYWLKGVDKKGKGALCDECGRVGGHDPICSLGNGEDTGFEQGKKQKGETPREAYDRESRDPDNVL